MQIYVFGVKWDEVTRRRSVAQFVEEVLHTDDIDLHTIDIPNQLWRSDSWMQHFEAAEELEALREASESAPLMKICEVISTGEATDELGLSDLTEGVNFLSLSPPSAQELAAAFAEFCESKSFSGLTPDTQEWLSQWRKALDHLCDSGFGVIGHAG